jgi:hypothetical protein
MTARAAGAVGQLPAPGIDRRAVRPPFGFAIDIPEPWLVLDLDPRTSAQWVRQLVRRRATGTRRTAREAWAAAVVVRDVIAALQAQGVLLAAILAGRIGEEVVGASITLGWERSPGNVDLDGLGLSLARASPGAGELVQHRRVDLVAVSDREALRLRGREKAWVPGSTTRREVMLHQLFVPVEDPTWLAVVTATTGLLQLGDVVGEAALHVAGSLRTGDAAG